MLQKILKWMLMLLISSLSISCVTQRKCLEKFPPTTDTIIKTVVRDSIVYKDTVITITIPGDIQIDSVPIPCPEPPPTYVPDTARVETEFAYALAWFDHKSIKIKLVQKKSELEIRLDNALKEAYHWKSEYEKITVTPQPIKYIPKFYKMCFWILIGEVIAIIGYILLKFKLIKL